MFSGIIDRLGAIKKIDTGAKPVLMIEAGEGWLKDVAVGDSIAVNGVCLTVVEKTDDAFSADVMPETLRATDLGGLRRGDPVNLEKSLRAGDRIGGHFVSGHVDCAGSVKGMKREKNAIIMTIAIDRGLTEFIAKKGSVAVDGISLTVVDALPDGFTISLIPHTLKMTTLGAKKIGSPVNIEVDMLARYVRRKP